MAEDQDQVVDALLAEIDKAKSTLRLTSVVCLQADPLLVSVDGVGSVPALQQGITMAEGDAAWAIWAPPRKPIVIAGADGGGAQGLFGSGVDQSGSNANAGGLDTVASAVKSFAVGDSTQATAPAAFAEGWQTVASGYYSHAAGISSTASGYCSHAEGNNTQATDSYSHAEGAYTTASGPSSHAEGTDTIASGTESHAEGDSTTASGDQAHAEGQETTASGDESHAEGSQTTASGFAAHAEGNSSTASGDYSHAEGNTTTASALGSHSEGEGTTASGVGSHAEGASTEASGETSHAEGQSTTASGEASHAEGNFTFAHGHYAHVQGDGGVAFRAMEDAHSSQNPDATLQHTLLNIVSDWPTGDIHVGGGTNPILIPVHDGYFDAKVTIWLGNLTDRWDLTFRGTNDATNFAGRDTGTVTITASAGGSALVYGTSAISWDVTGDSAGNVLITPSATTGSTARYAHVELFELHANV